MGRLKKKPSKRTNPCRRETSSGTSRADKANVFTSRGRGGNEQNYLGRISNELPEGERGGGKAEVDNPCKIVMRRIKRGAQKHLGAQTWPIAQESEPGRTGNRVLVRSKRGAPNNGWVDQTGGLAKRFKGKGVVRRSGPAWLET